MSDNKTPSNEKIIAMAITFQCSLLILIPNLFDGSTKEQHDAIFKSYEGLCKLVTEMK